MFLVHLRYACRNAAVDVVFTLDPQYAFDDFTISQVAKILNKGDDAAKVTDLTEYFWRMKLMFISMLNVLVTLSTIGTLPLLCRVAKTS